MKSELWLMRKKKRTGPFLSGPKFSFQVKENVTFHLETNLPVSGGTMERLKIQVARGPC